MDVLRGMKALLNGGCLDEHKGCPLSSLFPPKSELALNVGICHKAVPAEKVRSEQKERQARDPEPPGSTKQAVVIAGLQIPAG